MRAFRVLPTTILVLGLSVACSKDATGPTINLSQAEVTQLLGEVSAAISTVNMGFTVARNTGGPAIPLVPDPFRSPATNIGATVDCAGGGTVSAAGSVSGTATINFDVTFAFNACKTTNYTVGGSLRFFGSASTTPTTVALTETMRGTLTVRATDGRSGSCAVDFTMSVNGPPTGPTVTASGTVCGFRASATVT